MQKVMTETESMNKSPINIKKCTRCESHKSVNDFRVRNKKTGNRDTICKQCRSKAATMWKIRIAYTACNGCGTELDENDKVGNLCKQCFLQPLVSHPTPVMRLERCMQSISRHSGIAC